MKEIRTSFHQLPDGSILEMLWNPITQEARFVHQLPDGNKSIIPEYVSTDLKIEPLADSSLIEHKIILLPSEPMPYVSQDDLLKRIEEFIRRYVELDTYGEYLCQAYVLFAWLYDKFTALPYLRFFNPDKDTGKTRALQTVGALCYKPLFLSGSVTAAALYRILDKFNGTLVIDEADLRRSDMWTDIIKILNAGYMQGLAVLRTEKSDEGFEVKAFPTFSPKLVTGRQRYDDEALESRFLTINMLGLTRTDIPLQLTEDFWDEARNIRNMLLSYRLDNFGRKFQLPGTRSGVDSRLQQILQPLRAIGKNDVVLNFVLDEIEQGYQEQSKADRQDSDIGYVLRAIKLLRDNGKELTMQNIANNIIVIELTNKGVGDIVRKRLNLRTKHTSQGSTIIWEDDRMKALFDKWL